MYCDPYRERLLDPDSYTLLCLIDTFSDKYLPLVDELLKQYALTPSYFSIILFFIDFFNFGKG